MSILKRTIASALVAAAPAVAAAQEVVLTSQSTGFILAGRLVEFTGDAYIIDSSIGRLNIPSSDMICDGGGCPNAGGGAGGFETAFGVVGSNIIGADLMPTLIEAYSFALGGETERVTGDRADSALFRLKDGAGTRVAEINLDAQGSSAAFPSLINGDALIGMSSRPVMTSEMDALQSAGIGPINKAGSEHVLALDGLILVVSPSNPIRSMSIIDAAEIFSGAINNWAAIGGPDAPINIYAPAPDSGGGQVFQERVLNPLGESFAPGARILGSAREIADAVANDPNGIGLTGLAFERNARALNIEMPCGIVVEPNEFNVKTEEYPLSRRLFLYTTGKPLPRQARGFLEYALSDDAQGEIADIGFVNQTINSISLNQQGRRIAEAFIDLRDPAAQRLMREMALELLDADRLTTTFRFQPGSTVLDVKSEGDLGRLARHIASGALAGKEIVLIGFADEADRFEANTSLSSQRAAQLRASLSAELSRLGRSDAADIITMGFGPLAPVACGEDEFSTVSNRRVEVWVRDRL